VEFILFRSHIKELLISLSFPITFLLVQSPFASVSAGVFFMLIFVNLTILNWNFTTVQHWSCLCGHY